jgi:hypothetical protein
MIEPLIPCFHEVELTYGGHGSSHNRNFCLPESVDALFHVSDNADGRIPSAQWALWVIGLPKAPAPQSGQKAIVRWIGILILINDECTVLPAQLAEDDEAAMEVLLKDWSVVQHRECPGNVVVPPWFISHAIQSVDHLGGIAVSTDIGASRKQEIRCKTLHIIEIMHAIEGFPASENLIASSVEDHHVAQDLGLQFRGNVGAPFTRFLRKGLFQRVQSERRIKRDSVIAIARMDQEG